MLSTISWQHFLAAILIIAATYYIYVFLRYYQREIASLFNHKQEAASLFPSVQSAPFQVMGTAKPDTAVSFNETQDLHFAEPLPDEVETESNPDPSQELVIEAGNLMDAFRESGSKQEFLALLKILIEPHKRFITETELPATLLRVIELSKAKLPFPLTPVDIQYTTV